MKAKWLGLALVVVVGHAWAQVGELYNAEVTDKTSITYPAKAIKATEGQWLAFSLPAQAGTRSPCCWQGKWNRMRDVGCSLESKHENHGTRSDSPATENVIVYSQIRDGQAYKLRVVGESCPVEGNGAQVTWIGAVDNAAGLDWLETVVRSDAHHSSSGSALFAIALHRSTKAGQRLYSLAKETAGDLSEEAVFWLGESRGNEGFKLLKRLLVELPKGDTRREINFALGQNSTPEAAKLLFEISKSDNDPEQRGQAMFWLAEEYPQRAQGWLLEVIKTERDKDVLEQAVFAISQLPADNASQILLNIAKDTQSPRAVRRQALFWLAQSEDDNTIAALTELLIR